MAIKVSCNILIPNPMKTRVDTAQVGKPRENIPFIIHPLQGREQYMGELHAEPSKVKSFEIIWVSRGSGNIVIDTTPYPIRENTLFYIAPGQILKFQAISPTEG